MTDTTISEWATPNCCEKPDLYVRDDHTVYCRQCGSENVFTKSADKATFGVNTGYVGDTHNADGTPIPKPAAEPLSGWSIPAFAPRRIYTDGGDFVCEARDEATAAYIHALRQRLAEAETEVQRWQLVAGQGHDMWRRAEAAERKLESAAEALTSIHDCEEPRDNRADDDADWRFVALEMKRVARLAIGTLRGGSDG